MKEFSISKISNFADWIEIPKLDDFSSYWSQKKPLKIEFRAYRTDTYLYFRFDASCPNPLVFVMDNTKMEVIHSERVEIFFRSNEKMQPYYCLEIDAKGRVLDYKAQLYRNFDYEWNWPEPLSIISTIENQGYSVQGKISFSVLNDLGLINNRQIQVGLFRGHCLDIKENNAKMEWISWMNPNTAKPDFHVSSAFGVFLL